MHTIAENIPNVMNITYETGGDIIRRVRAEQGISMENFARDWDMSEKTLADWEKNRVSPRFEFVMDVLQTYGFEITITRKDVKNDENGD